MDRFDIEGALICIGIGAFLIFPWIIGVGTLVNVFLDWVGIQ